MSPDEAGSLRRVTLITGASGGIGADLARVFARNGHDLALVARNREKLQALAEEIEKTGRPLPLIIAIDLAQPSACANLSSELKARRASPDILVNNAGFGLVGQARNLDPAEQIEMTDLNIRSLTELTLHFLPDIINVRGRILNVASVAAFLAGPLKAMPGMSAMEVAEAGYAGLMAGQRRVVPGVRNKIMVSLVPFIPNALLLPAVARLQARRKVSYWYAGCTNRIDSAAQPRLSLK